MKENFTHFSDRIEARREGDAAPPLLERLCTALVALLMGAVLLFLAAVSMAVTCHVYGGREVVEYCPDRPALHLLALLAVVGLGAVLMRRGGGAPSVCRDPGKFRRLLLALAGLYTAWLIFTGFSPISDQRMVMESAQALLRGDYSPWEPHGFLYAAPVTPRGYAYTYPSQNGLILFFAVITFFFRGLAPYAAQALNIFFLFMGMYYLSRLFEIVFRTGNRMKTGRTETGRTETDGAEMDGEGGADGKDGMGGEGILWRRGVQLLLLCYLPFSFYFTFIYGTMPGFAFSALALYEECRYLRSGNGRSFWAAAFSIILAVFLKPNYLIVLAAMVIYLLSYGVFRRRARLFLAAVLLCVLYMGAGRGMNLFLERLTSYPASQGSPMIAWVEMGLMEGSMGPGWFNFYNVKVFSENGLDPDRTSAAVKEDLRETLSAFAADPGMAADFFVRKSSSIWADPTFQGLWIQQVKGDSWLFPAVTESLFEQKGAANRIFVAVCNWLQSLCYLGALLFLILFRRRLSWVQLFPGVVFLGGFLFHLAWEAKGQYTVCYFVLLIPYAVRGLAEASRRAAFPVHRAAALSGMDGKRRRDSRRE